MISGKIKAPAPVIRRLSNYYHLLMGLRQRQIQRISSTALAEMVEYNPVQVRKDLQLTGLVGKPKTGFLIDEMEDAIRRFMGWELEFQAVLFGVGNLGSALLRYPWREEHGLRFIAAFDSDPARCNILVNNIPVYHTDYFPTFSGEHEIHIGIVAVPAGEAQKVADLLIKEGIKGIWNFSHAHLKTPAHATVENAIFTQSLAILTRRLVESQVTGSGKESS